MDPKNLDTAERMARKRRELKEMLDLLMNDVSNAEVTVTVRQPFSPAGDKLAGIQSDTFNALMAQLIEREISNIDELVKGL